MLGDMIDGDAGEECGVIGVWAPGVHAAFLIGDGLIALQHRGQESAGLTVGDRESISTYREMGLVADMLRGNVAQRLVGHVGIGHVRYSTTGESTIDNAQPLHVRTPGRAEFALAHNGNLTDLPVPVAAGAAAGPARTSRSDTRQLAMLLGRENGSLADAMATVLPHARGAYSLVGISDGMLYAARDPHGFRPLCLGFLPDGGWAVASETAALQAIGASVLREVEPGEIIEAGEHGIRSRRFDATRHSLCVFEHVYFARPDSVIGGRSVYEVRRALGMALARHAPAEADVVIPVPDTGRIAALGYAEQSGIRYGEGLFRNSYVNRSFIAPAAGQRQQTVRMKLSPIEPVVAGRRLVVVDDSIVRATSIKQVVAMLRKAGAAEVHIRVASPPIRWPCFYGVDIRGAGELIADRLGVEEIGRLVDADTLEYLPAEDLVTSARGNTDVCTACFTGAYPD
jgi:amidophosphoribosyltransferase